MKDIERITNTDTLMKTFRALGKDCCITNLFAAGIENPVKDFTGAVDDFLEGRSQYFVGEQGSYIRTFVYNKERIVDFGRRCRHIPENSARLATKLGEPIIVPLRHEAIGELDGFQNVTQVTRTFEFKEMGQETPYFRQCFLEPNTYAVGIIQPGWKAPTIVRCDDHPSEHRAKHL